MSHTRQTPTDFDQYAANYEQALLQGISVSGESREFFARGRIERLALRLGDYGEKPKVVIDYGCGTGGSIPLLRDILGAEFIIGLDVSTASLEVARKEQASERCRFLIPADYEPRGEADLVVSNGVFHHIPPDERAAAVSFIQRSLRPHGILCLWENNPWNPGTRYVMSRISFDRDALPFSALKARQMLRRARFTIVRTDHLFVFPRALRWLRPLEALTSGLPLGAQYQVLSRRPD